MSSRGTVAAESATMLMLQSLPEGTAPIRDPDVEFHETRLRKAQ